MKVSQGYWQRPCAGWHLQRSSAAAKPSGFTLAATVYLWVTSWAMPAVIV